MTITQFDLTGFVVGMKVDYNGKTYELEAVDFQEKLVAINLYADPDDLKWVRCENIKLILSTIK